MKNSTLQLILSATLCVASASCSITDEEATPDDADVFAREAPEFPNSEFQRGTEGWVVLDYSVGRGGVVEYIHIRDSSGNGNFDDAAVAAVENWRYEPGQERELSVLMGFVRGGEKTPISKQFHSLNQEANELIDEGKLEQASEVLAKARTDDDLSLTDQSYSYLTEGRIVGKQGDRAKQLELYRRAMIGNGRWLAYENYLEALRGTIVLQLDQGDIASAVRDYDILASTLEGKKMGRDLEDLVNTAREQVNADPSVMEPYVVADNGVLIMPGRPPRYSGSKPPPSRRIYNTSPRHDATGPKSSRSGSRSRSGSGSKKD